MTIVDNLSNEQSGDTSTSTKVTPFERFMSWTKNPTIAKLRAPGKADGVQFPIRTGQVSFKLGDEFGNLNLTLRGDGTVLINHPRCQINEVVQSTYLVSLLSSGKSTDPNCYLWLTGVKNRVAIRRSDLCNYLWQAGV